MTDKKELRAKIFAEMDALTDGYVASSDAGIYANLVAVPEFLSAETVLFYYSVKREVDTRRAIAFALEQGKTICLPVSLPKGILVAKKITSLDTLVPGRLDIPCPPETAETVAPEALDFIVVPAVAFDREGYRLGHGGGYYDRYLPQTRAFTAGLARDALLKQRVPREPHDVPVRRVVTETSVTRYV